MATYVHRPTRVEGLKITRVDDFPDDPESGYLMITLEDGGMQLVTPAMTARYVPEVGDYYVVTQDGYDYVNPKSVFEGNYEEVA